MKFRLTIKCLRCLQDVEEYNTDTAWFDTEENFTREMVVSLIQEHRKVHPEERRQREAEWEEELRLREEERKQREAEWAAKKKDHINYQEEELP